MTGLVRDAGPVFHRGSDVFHIGRRSAGGEGRILGIRAARVIVSVFFFRPLRGLDCYSFATLGLRPWAAFFRRFAAFVSAS